MSRTVIPVVLSLVSAVIGAGLVLVLQPRDVYLQTSGPETDDADRSLSAGTVEAREIVLADATGRVRIRLGFEGEREGTPRPRLSFYSDTGTELLSAGLGAVNVPFVELQSSDLPNSSHKRIRLCVDGDTARMDLGHGELEEIALQSAPPSDPDQNYLRLRGRNGSTASFFLDEYGQGTIGVTDRTTQLIFREPEWQPLFPEEN